MTRICYNGKESKSEIPLMLKERLHSSHELWAMNLAEVKQTIKPWWFYCIHKLQFRIFSSALTVLSSWIFFVINWKVRDRATGFFCCLLVLFLTARENRQIRYSLAKTLRSWHGYMKMLARVLGSLENDQKQKQTNQINEKYQKNVQWKLLCWWHVKIQQMGDND